MFPALRLGYVVVPKDLVDAFSSARDATDVFSSTLFQIVMTDFIREGHFARHLRKMRMLYMERRSVLVDAIAKEAGDKLEVIGAEAGMHLVALLPKGVNDVAVGATRREGWNFRDASFVLLCQAARTRWPDPRLRRCRSAPDSRRHAKTRHLLLIRCF